MKHIFTKHAALLACAAAFGAFTAGSAQAHTPYLLPTSFDAQPNTSVSLDAGYAEKGADVD